MSENIKVSFDEIKNVITIQKNNAISEYKITDIKSIFNGVDIITNYNDMIKQQQIINYLDSIKDGANVATLQQLNMYPLAFVDDMRPNFPKDLHEYETNITNAYKPYIKQITWTKVNKREALDEKLQIENIFRDSGIGADVFIENFQLINTIASYIDPATRAPPTAVWPSTGNSIEFTTEFMNLFGMEQSSLKSLTTSITRFNYTIITNNILFINDGKTPDNNLDYFAGNTNKNKILKSSNAPINQKKALISLKEWGDKMQVLILFVWSRLNQGKTYTMITCDKVVFLLCLLLKVKCIFTGQIKEDNTKKYSIEVFEPSGDPKRDAVNRYNAKKKSIIKENDAFIKMIQLLEKNPSQSIYIDAFDSPFTFSAEFYNKIYTDILNIQQTLQRIPILNKSTQLNESDIEKASKKLAEDYLLINFIKKIGNKIKITRCVKYTNANKFKASFNNSTKSFFDIAVNNYKISGNIKRGGTISRDNVNKVYKAIRPISKYSSETYKTEPYKTIPSQIKSPSITQITPSITNIPEVIDSEEFKGSDFYTGRIMFDFYQDVPVPKEENPDDQFINFIRQEKSVDLNATLYLQVNKIATANNKSQFIDSIYTMVLYHAYYNNGIPIDYVGYENSKSDLEMIIEQIIQEDLDLSEITIYSGSDMAIDETMSGMTTDPTSSYQTTTTSPSYPSNQTFSNYFWQSTPSVYQSPLSVMGGTKNKTKRSKYRHKKTKQNKTISRKKNIRKLVKRR